MKLPNATLLLAAWLLPGAPNVEGETAPESGWTYLPAGDAAGLPALRDLFAAGDGFFAVGERGAFYRLAGGKIWRIESPTAETLNVVWARSPEEVYCAGESGVVMRFDGKELKVLGDPVRALMRRPRHPELPARETPLSLQHIWAGSARDVYVSGSPCVLLRFDGSEWQEVDIGAEQVVVNTITRLGRAVVTPRVGPIWGSGPDDVWVRKEVVRHLESKPGQPLRFEYSFHETGNVLMRFDGDCWRETPATLPLETSENNERGPSSPEVLALSPDAVWTRFDNRLFLWEDTDWKPAAELPEAPEGSLSHWTACGPETALIYGRRSGFQRLEDGKWKSITGAVPAKGSMRKIAAASDGAIACLTYWRPEAVFFLRRPE